MSFGVAAFSPGVREAPFGSTALVGVLVWARSTHGSRPCSRRNARSRRRPRVLAPGRVGAPGV